MTEQEIQAIEARCSAATPGPWIPKHLKTAYLTGGGEHEVRTQAEVARWMVATVNVPPDHDPIADRDVEFIAAARSDVPALLAEVRKLRGVLRSVQWGSCDGCGAHRYCPACNASRLEVSEDDEYYSPGPHKEGCPVGAALEEEKP